MTITSVVLVLIGIALLYLGGEGLVRGAVDLARSLGLSNLAIGLTVVAFATSAPELAATLTASLRGAASVGVGNVLGSNIANIGLILGIAAFLQPLQSSARFVQREVPMMLLASAMLYPVFLNYTISRSEGAVLLALLLAYLGFCFRTGAAPPATEELLHEARPLWKSTLMVAAGVAFLVVGAYSLVEGAVSIARAFGVSERVIGLTMVAFGTSLPELASSIVAARHGHADIVLGNIIGSNIFNVLCILGLSALVKPMPVEPAALAVDFWIMMIFSVLVLPFHWPDLRLSRPAGGIFVGMYLLYIGFLFLGG